MTTNIGMLLFPRLTQLDLTGPFEILHRVPGARVHLLWKDLAPVRADSGMALLPTTTLRDCPPLDVVFVPGGIGQMELMNDPDVIEFLAAQGKTAKYVTSVCTGSLVLGAAGLLHGYEATTHWGYVELLPLFGARPSRARVVVDRNRITAGGVTAGIDFGLRIAAELAGEPTARGIQLALQYDPEPPFDSGSPEAADPELVEKMRRAMSQAVADRRVQIEKLPSRAAVVPGSPVSRFARAAD
jgi:cyclohexyl-isocyanide hydratase